MPGKVTLRSSARAEFVRCERGNAEPQMYCKSFNLQRIPKGLAIKLPSQARGEFRRPVRAAEVGGSRVRHAHVKVITLARTQSKPYFSRMVAGKLRYLERHISEIDGQRAKLMEPDGAGGTRLADPREFIAETRLDPKAYEIIIPPNDGAMIRDMDGLTTRIMETIEQDLGTKLRWVYAVHDKHDVAHPVNRHSHVIVRGVDDEGRELRINKEYLLWTVREVAQKEISAYPTTEQEKGWRLGPMSEDEAMAFKRQMEENLPRREERGFTKPRVQETEQEEARRRTRSRSMGED